MQRLKRRRRTDAPTCARHVQRDDEGRRVRLIEAQRLAVSRRITPALPSIAAWAELGPGTRWTWHVRCDCRAATAALCPVLPPRRAGERSPNTGSAGPSG